MCTWVLLFAFYLKDSNTNPSYASEVSVKRNELKQDLEVKFCTGLEKCLNLAISRVQYLLSSEQRKTDFRPDINANSGIIAGNPPSLACQHVVAFVTHINRETHQHLDGQNLKTFLHEFGMKLNRTLVDHFYNFTFSDTAESWFVFSHRRLLLMVSGRWMLSILRRQLFINTCTILMVVVVVLRVSAPYNRTVLMFVLKILTLILVESCFEFHMFFNCRNAVLALPILAFTSASEPPCSSMMLPSLGPMGFADSEKRQVVSPYIPNYFIDLPDCPSVPCTNNSCSGC
ncbi:unnamed protein product [Schistosoma margrebowiei]|uniref:Exocyst complex component Sec10-like alpha-helical bundle domain-containing protein n=1 Tax=Schistosoma margrebowiei TaxID=48269 RepID=A0A183L9P0_9TREM|nr:unnamed protein product [Schistosoma margrebowiei]